MKTKAVKFNYDKPIKIIQMKRNGFDIMFYSACLSALVVTVLYLICIHDGQFKIEFELWKTIVCIPLVILITFFKQLLDELRIYPKQLAKQHIWSIEDLMKLTKKDRKHTEEIMNHVLDSCFIVDDKCVQK